MTRRGRRLAVTGAAGLLYLALMGWSAGVLLGGGARRSISVLCSTIEALCVEWASAFTAESGVGVRMVRLSSGEALARLSRPGGTEDFDVWHGGPSDTYAIARDRGLLAVYRSPETARVPDAYRDPGGSWTGVYVGVLGFCSNRQALERLGAPVPGSWDDLLNPALRGHVSSPNPATSGTGYTIAWTQRVRLGSEDAALGYLAELDRNVLQYTTSGMAPARVAGRGEAAVALTFSQHCVQAVDEGHADLVVSYPREGTGVEVGSVALLAGAASSADARRYVDFAISRRAQELGARPPTAQLPTRDDVAADARLAGMPRLLEWDAEAAAEAKGRLVERFRAEVLG